MWHGNPVAELMLKVLLDNNATEAILTTGQQPKLKIGEKWELVAYHALTENDVMGWTWEGIAQEQYDQMMANGHLRLVYNWYCHADFDVEVTREKGNWHVRFSLLRVNASWWDERTAKDLEKLMTRGLFVVRDNRYLDHYTGAVHPESPQRLLSIHEMLDEQFPPFFSYIQPDAVPESLLMLVHTNHYIRQVKETANQSTAPDAIPVKLAAFTPTCPKTYEVANLAVGGCIIALDHLIHGEFDNALALIRPPSHHAMPDRASGFCIFNNVAIAVRWVQQEHKMNRILIVDLDIHHGDGIQEIFNTKKDVLYLSTHNLTIFADSGNWEETGEGAGQGYSVNIPLPKETTDEDFLHIYQEVLGDIFPRYKPEMVLVALGFDGHLNDPLGKAALSELSYGWLARLISTKCIQAGVRCLYVLEGGYDPDALAASMRQVVLALSTDLYGYPTVDTNLGRKIVNQARQIHAPYGVWT